MVHSPAYKRVSTSVAEDQSGVRLLNVRFYRTTRATKGRKRKKTPSKNQAAARQAEQAATPIAGAVMWAVTGGFWGEVLQDSGWWAPPPPAVPLGKLLPPLLILLLQNLFSRFAFPAIACTSALMPETNLLPPLFSFLCWLPRCFFIVPKAQQHTPAPLCRALGRESPAWKIVNHRREGWGQIS